MYECLKNILFLLLLLSFPTETIKNLKCDEFEKQFIFLRNDLIYIILHLVL